MRCGAGAGMGNRVGGRRRRPAVEERYTRPQGLYPHPDIDLRKLRRLILEAKLAPCHPGADDPRADLDECPICFLVRRPPSSSSSRRLGSVGGRAERFFVSDAVGFLSSVNFGGACSSTPASTAPSAAPRGFARVSTRTRGCCVLLWFGLCFDLFSCVQSASFS